MKKNIILLLLLSTLIGLPIFNSGGVYTTLITWKNKTKYPNKLVVTFYDEPSFFEYFNLPLDHIEDLHYDLITQGLKRIASGTKNIAVILDSSRYNFVKAKEAYSSVYDDDIEKPIIGTYFALPFFANAYSNQYGRVNFFHADACGISIVCVAETFTLIKKTIKLFSLKTNGYRYNKNENPALNNSFKEKLLASNYRSFIKKKILSESADITIKKYLKNISAIIKLTTEDDDCKQLTVLYKRALKFFNHHTASQKDLVKKVLWDVFKSHDCLYFNKQKSWIYSLNLYIEQLALKKVVQQSLNDYDVVLIFAKNLNLKKVTTFLQCNNFFRGLSFGGDRKCKKDNSEILVCTSLAFKETFNKISTFVDAQFVMNSCTNCFKIETADNRYKACGSCMSIFYCCKECQRADWAGHKSCCVKKILNL